MDKKIVKTFYGTQEIPYLSEAIKTALGGVCILSLIYNLELLCKKSL